MKFFKALLRKLKELKENEMIELSLLEEIMVGILRRDYIWSFDKSMRFFINSPHLEPYNKIVLLKEKI